MRERKQSEKQTDRQRGGRDRQRGNTQAETEAPILGCTHVEKKSEKNSQIEIEAKRKGERER